MGNIIVRPEAVEDVRAIDVVNLSAFEGETEARFVTAMRQSPTFIPELSLVAEFNGRIVGHILLSKVKLRREDGEVDILVLGPMSVVPSQSHRGIGTDLLQSAVERAGVLGYGAIVVVGYPEYYRRSGFQDASGCGIRYSLPVPGDVVTVMELKPGTLGKGGFIAFPGQFSDLYAQLTEGA